MSIVIQYDTNTGQVTNLLPQAHTPDYEGQAGNLIYQFQEGLAQYETDTSGLVENHLHWIYDNGLRDMTQSEIDAFYPPPSPPADWTTMMNQILGTAEWARIESVASKSLVSAIVGYIQQAQQGNDTTQSIINTWNYIDAQANVLSTEADVINAILVANNIPLTINQDGTMQTA